VNPSADALFAIALPSQPTRQLLARQRTLASEKNTIMKQTIGAGL